MAKLIYLLIFQGIALCTNTFSHHTSSQCLHWLLVPGWEKSISNEYPARTYSETLCTFSFHFPAVCPHPSLFETPDACYSTVYHDGPGAPFWHLCVESLVPKHTWYRDFVSPRQNQLSGAAERYCEGNFFHSNSESRTYLDGVESAEKSIQKSYLLKHRMARWDEETSSVWKTSLIIKTRLALLALFCPRRKVTSGLPWNVFVDMMPAALPARLEKVCERAPNHCYVIRCMETETASMQNR